MPGSAGERDARPYQNHVNPVKETPRLRPSVSSALSAAGTSAKTIYDSDGTAIPASHVNGYLLDAPDAFIVGHSKPLSPSAPAIIMGNMPLDGGNLIIEAKDYADFIAREPDAAPFVKGLTGSKEFINGLPRHCLWLKDAPPSALRAMPLVMERVAKCREMRLASKDAGTRKLASRPTLFRETNNPKTAIVIPKVSSERRDYVPMGFIDDTVIVTDLAFLVPDATLYHFGVLTSRMHNAWMRAVAGRLEMSYRYSKDIVYNNFVWPEAPAALNAEETENRRRGEDAGAGVTQFIASSDCGRNKLRPSPARPSNSGHPAENDAPRSPGKADKPLSPPRLRPSVSSALSAAGQTISSAAQAVLDARSLYPGSSLADLYDPLTMPSELVKAHAHLDALVDRAYGISPSCTDAERVAHLFRLYAERVEKLKGGKVEKCVV